VVRGFPVQAPAREQSAGACSALALSLWDIKKRELGSSVYHPHKARTHMGARSLPLMTASAITRRRQGRRRGETGKLCPAVSFDLRSSVRTRWACALLLLLALPAPAALGQTVQEFPPALPPAFGNIPVNGGRVQAIAVSPVDANRITAAHQFGGLWQTVNGGTDLVSP
jgi:hypothetical protein